jgi:hypothetical protein
MSELPSIAQLKEIQRLTDDVIESLGGPRVATAREQGDVQGVRSGSWLAALRELSTDMHRPSDRPCPTCRPISVLMGEPFGCYAYHARRGIHSDLVLPKSAANKADKPTCSG